MQSAHSSSLSQEHETEYNLATIVENSKGVQKADPSQFELLKVLGQGSFGKVSHKWDRNCEHVRLARTCSYKYQGL